MLSYAMKANNIKATDNKSPTFKYTFFQNLFSYKSLLIWLSVIISLIIYTRLSNIGMSWTSKLLSGQPTGKTILQLIIEFTYIFASIIGLYNISVYLRHIAGMYWRQQLTNICISQWCNSSHFSNHKIEHIDKRITDDIENMTNSISYLMHNAINSSIALAIYLPVFISLTYSLGQRFIILSLLGSSVSILIGLFLRNIFMQRIAIRHEMRLKTDATLRQGIINIDKNLQSIILLDGSQSSLMQMQGSLNQDLYARLKLLNIEDIYNYATALVAKINWNIGYFLFIPCTYMQYLTLQQALHASQLLSHILYAIALIPNNTDKFSKIGVHYSRIRDVYNLNLSISSLITINSNNTSIATGIKRIEEESTQTHIALKLHASIYSQSNKLLLKNIQFNILKGEHILLYGKSGIGKTTLLHAIHGHYKHAIGTLSTIANAKLYFMPHSVYIADLDIVNNVLYPIHTLSPSSEEITNAKKILQLVLPNYTNLNLHNLSAGEKQKLQIARLLYHKQDYDFIFIDEPFTNLDKTETSHFLQLIYKHFPNSAIITIMHDGIDLLSVDMFNQQINLEQFQEKQ